MADGVRYVDHSATVKAKLEAELHRRLDRCAILVDNKTKELVSTAFPPASSPGEPPAKRTGHLRRNIAWERVGWSRRIGSNLLYHRVLETGGHNIAARPSLRPALLHSSPRIEAILGAPIV